MQRDAQRLLEMETYGEICAKHFSFEWKLPNFFSLIQNRKEYESPEFEFCDAKWTVVIHPNFVYPEWMSFVLFKRDCAYRKHDVCYKLAIMDGESAEYVFANGKHAFFSFVVFSEEVNVIMYSKLLQDKNIISPDGTLTISCTMKCDLPIMNSSATAVEIGEVEFLEDGATNTEESYLSGAKEDVIPAVLDPEKLMRDLETLFSNGQDSDVTLIVGDHKFTLHKAILGTRSPVFAAMFAQDTEQRTRRVVNIPDFDPDVFGEFLLYLYTAKVEKFSSKNVVSLYSAAHKYSTQELKTKCVEFMRNNLSLDMFCSVVSLAVQHDESSLLENAAHFFVKNLKQIIVTAEWQEFVKENPVTANEFHIKASEFYVSPEEELRTFPR